MQFLEPGASDSLITNDIAFMLFIPSASQNKHARENRTRREMENVLLQSGQRDRQVIIDALQAGTVVNAQYERAISVLGADHRNIANLRSRLDLHLVYASEAPNSEGQLNKGEYSQAVLYCGGRVACSLIHLAFADRIHHEETIGCEEFLLSNGKRQLVSLGVHFSAYLMAGGRAEMHAACLFDYKHRSAIASALIKSEGRRITRNDIDKCECEENRAARLLVDQRVAQFNAVLFELLAMPRAAEQMLKVKRSFFHYDVAPTLALLQWLATKKRDRSITIDAAQMFAILSARIITHERWSALQTWMARLAPSHLISLLRCDAFHARYSDEALREVLLDAYSRASDRDALIASWCSDGFLIVLMPLKERAEE